MHQYTSLTHWSTSPPNMNSYFALLCLSVFVVFASANPIGGVGVPLYQVGAQIDSIPNSNYGFNYAVNDPSTGDNKAQWETRNGDVVQGAYSLVEPDGNIRLVEYTADPIRGFNAVVKRTGPNVHSVSAIPVAAPVAHVAPVAEVAHVEEAVPLAPTYDLSHYAPLAPTIDYAPLAPIIDHAPIIEHAPIVPLPQLDISPLWLPQASPWVHLSGSSWGDKGNIVRRWAAGPISLDGKTLTIRTKHH